MRQSPRSTFAVPPSGLLAAVLAAAFSVGAANAGEPEQAELSIPDLIAMLDDDDAGCRRTAIEALAGRGVEARPAVSAIARALTDSDANVSAAAATALGELSFAPDIAIPALVKLFPEEARSDQGPLWLAAGQASGQYGESAVPYLIEALKDERIPVRRAAMIGLFVAGPKANTAVPVLIDVLEEDEPQTRKYALNAFIGIGPDAKDAVPALIKTLASEDFHTQYWACRALGSIGAAASPAAPKLIELVQDGVTSVRRNAAAALGNIGPTVGQRAVDTLVGAFSDWSQPVRQQAVIALGKLGPLAAPALPVIEKGLRDGEFRPAANAAKTLWLLKPESDLPLRMLLVELATGDDPGDAVIVMGEIGVAIGAVDKVAELLKEDYRWTRLYAAEALGKMGPDAAPSARPALEAALDDEDKEIREAVKEALDKVGRSDRKPR